MSVCLCVKSIYLQLIYFFSYLIEIFLFKFDVHQNLDYYFIISKKLLPVLQRSHFTYTVLAVKVCFSFSIIFFVQNKPFLVKFEIITTVLKKLTNLNSSFGQTDPQRNFFPQKHVRIVCLLKQCFQLLQLLRTKRRSVPSLPSPSEHILCEKIPW